MGSGGDNLIPRSSRKLEKGSGALSLLHRECHDCILHPGLKLSDDCDCYMIRFTKAW